MTTNTECVENILAAHREARQWDDHAVAIDLLAQLGLDPAGNAAKAKPVVMPGITEEEVVAHETAAKEAVAKAEAARAALKAQKAEEVEAPPASEAQRLAAARAQAQQPRAAAPVPPAPRS